MECIHCKNNLSVNDYVCPRCKKLVYFNLIRDAQIKKENAIAFLIEKTQNKLYYIVYRYLKDQGIAEDIVQESYIKAFQSLDTLSDPEKFESWLTTIAINKSKTYLNVKKNTKFVDFTSIEDADSEVSFEDNLENEKAVFEPEAQFNYSELKEGLNTVLDELPENQRMSILLYYMDEFKISEISKIMGIPQGSVKSNLNYARKTIKNKIEELRKHNKSFYSIAPIPFLVWMLKDQLRTVTVSAQVSEKVMKTLGVARAVNISTDVANATASTVAKNAGYAAAKGISTKIAIGIVAGVVGVGGIGAGIYGGYNLIKNINSSNNVEENTIEENTELTPYTVLDVDVPDFENTPMDDDNGNGFLVKVDDFYGFIDSSGSYILDPTYEGVMLTDLTNNAENGFDVCMFSNSDQTNVQDGISVNGKLGENGMNPTCGHGFGSGGFPKYLSVDDQVISGDMSNSIYHVQLDEPIIVNKLDREFTDATDLFSNVDTSVDMDHYYIVTPENKIFGPYDHSEFATFSMNRNTNQTQDVEVISDLFNSYVKGLFYEKTEDGYRIWNKDGTKCYEEIVDFAEPISNNAMKIKKDGKLGIINKNLELVLLGDFEDISNVIDNRAYVKMDGVWKLIELD